MTTKDDGDNVLAEASRGRSGLFRDLLGFLGQTKKWWMAPIILCIVVLGLLIFLGGTAAAPFIYTLF